MARHANPRFYLGPQVNELILGLGRVFNVSLSDPKPDVTIDFVHRKCVTTPVVSTWTAYAVDTDGNAHFEIPADFITDIATWVAGFYDGSVNIGGCHAADVELIKAPGHYTVSANSVEGKCAGGTQWVEPDCLTDNPIVVGSSTTSGCSCVCNGAADQPCVCNYLIRSNCPMCNNGIQVQKANVSQGYIEIVKTAFDPTDLTTIITLDTSPTPTQGDVTQWTVEVCNNGPADAANVCIASVVLPVGMTPAPGNGVVSVGGYSPASGLWVIGNLAVGDCETLILEATSDFGTGGTTITATTDEATGDATDTNVTLDVLTSDINVVGAPTINLQTVKTVLPANVAPGATFQFIITVTNVGALDATGVNLVDLVTHPLFTSVTGTPSQGAYVVGTGVWTIGTLLSGGGSATLIIDVVTAGGSPSGFAIDNTTTRALAVEPDFIYPAGDSLTATVTFL